MGHQRGYYFPSWLVTSSSGRLKIQSVCLVSKSSSIHKGYYELSYDWTHFFGCFVCCPFASSAPTLSTFQVSMDGFAVDIIPHNHDHFRRPAGFGGSNQTDARKIPRFLGYSESKPTKSKELLVCRSCSADVLHP